MAVNSADLQTKLLELLAGAGPRTDLRLGRGEYYLSEQLTQQFPPGLRPGPRQIMEAVWSLIGQGLAYIDFWQPAPENWTLHLTESGRAAAEDREYNPDNVGVYLARLSETAPDASNTVLQYAREAAVSYTARCYLASTVMLGVASEAAFLEMVRSFSNWLSEDERKPFLARLDKPNATFFAKFDDFRRKVEPRKAELPDELAGGLTLTLLAVSDLLGIYRNDAGHPTGKQIDRSLANNNLQVFARYLQKLYDMKNFFDSMAPNANSMVN